MTTTSHLDRYLDPLTEVFTPTLAQKLIDLRADPKLQEEIEGLRRKANEGTLNQDEDAAYKDFVEAVDVIAILQAKARHYLDQHSA